MKFERVTAADLRPGDQFAYARTHTPMTLEAVESVGAVSRWLRPAPPHGRIRPRHTTKFWRVVA